MPKLYSAGALDVSTSRARPANGSPVGVTVYPEVATAGTPGRASPALATSISNSSREPAAAPAPVAPAAVAHAAPPCAATLEALERRQFLSVSLDAGGWTVVTPAAGDRVIYVSSSGGDDDRSGTAPSSAVKTLDEGVGRLRDGSGDQLLLKSGDVWRESFGMFRKSGRSADEPLVIGSYGTGSRPRIESGRSTAFTTGSDSSPEVNNLALIGLHFYSQKRDPDSSNFDKAAVDSTPYGIRIASASSNVLIEDCRIEAYAQNLVVEQAGFGPIRNVTLRRSVILDAYSTSTHAEGIYAQGVEGLTLEENFFDHNGWDDRVKGGQATVYNHNAYLDSGNSDVVVRGNVFANAASHGLQMRAGGYALDNFFYGNPLGMSFGLVNGATVKPGGVSGVVNGNVFVGTRDIDGAPRGMGIEVGNTRPGGATVISNNVFLNDAVVDAGQDDAPRPGEHGQSAAITLVYGKNNRNADDAAGINDLTVLDNVVYRWNAGLSVQEGVEPGGQGPLALNGVTVKGNDFQAIKGDEVVQHYGLIRDGQERWSGNRYDAGNADPVVLMGEADVPLGSWVVRHEPDAKEVRPAYVDPARSVDSYEKSLAPAPVPAPANGARSIVVSGGNASFFAGARGLSRRNWNARFTARSIIDHVRAGFEEQGAPPRDWRAAAPPTAAAALPQAVTTADTGLTFTVTYKDETGVDVASIDSDDVRLVRKGGPKLAATLASVREAPDGSVVATYRVEAPRGLWRRQDRGYYTAIIGDGQVRDVEGFPAAAGPLAQVTLDVTTVAPPPEVEKVRFKAKRAQALTVTFSSDVNPDALRPTTLVLTAENGAALDSATFAVTYDAASRSVTWTFPALAGAALPEGKYAVSLRAGDILNPGYLPLDGNRDGIGGDDFAWGKTLRSRE